MDLLNFAGVAAVAAATTPFVLMSLRSGAINLEREYRGHQFLMPILALIYCIPVMIFVNRIAESLVNAVNSISGLLYLIPYIGPVLERIFRVGYWTMRLGYGAQLLCNTMIITMFCAMKRMALPVIKKWWSKWKFLYRHTSAAFYTELGDRSVLYQSFANMRDYFKVMYYGFVVLGALLCMATILFSDYAGFNFPSYPVFGIIIIGEIFFFLDGYTFDEKPVSEQDENEKPTPDCEALRENLRLMFEDRINLSDEVEAGRQRQEETSQFEDDGIEDELDRTADAYFEAMAKGGEENNVDYITATKKLLHNKSVLIHNPFYHDLTKYMLLPIFHELLDQNKVLVICGRMTNEQDIIDWLSEGITNVTNLPKLWRIAKISEYIDVDSTDIGVLGFDRLYDLDNLIINEPFFKKVSFIIILEPSNLLGTGQIGMRSILQYCEDGRKKITYCAVDRNADGLVDALSHAVRQSITEVVASPVPHSAYCRIFWKAEGPGMQTRILPRISHYLGIGGEIASQVMSKGVEGVHWYSGSKMPLVDLRWNVEQYYAPICKYIHAPEEQYELDNRFKFYENLWQADFQERAFIIVEDEFCNVFEMSRAFAARIRDKGFINVLSESYMLRDYMCGNKELFTNDPKAIPSIVPDYARTERNFVLRTLMLMAAAPISEATLIKELSLLGYEVSEPRQKLRELIERHTGISDFYIQARDVISDIGKKQFSTLQYRVDREIVNKVFDSALRSAYYVIENERTRTYPMGNRLMGHIDQVILPGQFFSYGGRYYQALSISPENGIIVRRAADHLNGRPYYRQLRSYTISQMSDPVNARQTRGITIQSVFANIDVVTDGYLQMKAGNMLTDSMLVNLDDKRYRSMVHKEILQVKMPEATDEIRFTLCALFNELFKTIYPNEFGYLVAAAGKTADSIKENGTYMDLIRSVVPELSIDGADDSIFFIEDSVIDLGLLVSVERNFQRIMEICADYLEWYLDPERQDNEEEEEEKEKEKEEDKEKEEEEEKQEDTSGPAADMEPVPAGEIITSAADDQAPDALPVSGEQGDNGATAQDAGDHEGIDVGGEDEELLDKSGSTGSDVLKHVEYLTYGYKETPAWLSLPQTLEFLTGHQYLDSNLHRSRKKARRFGDDIDYDPNQKGVHYCDFCGKAMNPGEYDVLADGRERCFECGKDAIRTVRKFRKVFKETLAEMEELYGIKFDMPIKVRMVSAGKVNDEFNGKTKIPTYKPTSGFDPRILGFARSKGGKYTIMVEYGSPLWKAKATLVHELTHIWQYNNWDYDTKKWKLPNGITDTDVSEGMAVWSEIQYLTSMGQRETAVRYMRAREREIGSSPYGTGMQVYLNKYPIQDKSSIDKRKIPFAKKAPV